VTDIESTNLHYELLVNYLLKVYNRKDKAQTFFKEVVGIHTNPSDFYTVDTEELN